MSTQIDQEAASQLMLAKEVPWMAAWEWQGEKIVVLGVESSDTLPELMDQALNKTLLVYPVRLTSSSNLTGLRFRSTMPDLPKSIRGR